MTFEDACQLKQRIEAQPDYLVFEVFARFRGAPAEYWAVGTVFYYRNWRKQVCKVSRNLFSEADWREFSTYCQRIAREAQEPGTRPAAGKRRRASGYYHQDTGKEG